MTHTDDISERERARRAEQSRVALIQAAELRALLGGVSDMWVWRHLKDGSLPRPLMISKRRFWRRDEIAAYIDRQSAARQQGEAA